MYPSLYHTEYFHCPENSRCSPYSSLHPPPTPWQPDLFIICTVLPFPECHKVGIIQYAAFSDWLLSLSDMHFSVLLVFAWLDSSLLLSAE